MEERRNFLEGRPLSLISKGSGLRLARGEVLVPTMVEEDELEEEDGVGWDEFGMASCVVEVETASLAFQVEKDRMMRRGQGVPNEQRYASSLG